MYWRGWAETSGFWAAATLAVALLVSLGDLRHPSGALWDESYYLTTTQRYLEGRAQYASHPPLGLMLMAAGDRLMGRNDPATTHAMVALKTVDGKQIPVGYDFFGIRFASALCGALASLAFYAMVVRLTGRARLAALLTIPILFDNALIVQFRAAQLDGPQMLFTVLSLAAFLGAIRGVRSSHIAFGICVGLAAMVRLNGVLLSLLGIALLWMDIRRDGFGAARLRVVAAMLLPFVATVALVLLVHVLASPHMPALDEAGSKDLLYMSPRYQAWLRDGGMLSPAVFSDAATGYWRFMMADLGGMTLTDVNGSSPLYWPFGQKTITYRWVSGVRGTAYVQMVPNLLGWWLAGGAILAGIVTTFATRPLRDPDPRRFAIGALTAWYGVFLIANLVLAHGRVMYVYHYFMGLIVAYTVLALLLSGWLDPNDATFARRRRIAKTGGIAVICTYFWLFPLTYNVRIDDRLCRSYNLVVPVVHCIVSARPGG